MMDDENGRPRNLTWAEADPVSYGISVQIHHLTGEGCEGDVVTAQLIDRSRGFIEWVSIIRDAVVFYAPADFIERNGLSRCWCKDANPKCPLHGYGDTLEVA